MKSINGVVDDRQMLDNIPIDLDADKVLERLKLLNEKKRLKHLKLQIENKRIEEIARVLIDVVMPVACHKALYKVARITTRSADTVEINGVKFTDRLLRVLLNKVEEVFPFVSTCGTEVYAIQVSGNDDLKQYCLNLIRRMVLKSANDYLHDHLRRQYALGKITRLNPPGELVFWPVVQFMEHFSILGEVEDLIGVTLTEPYLEVSGIVPLKRMMVPFFSNVRICFPADSSFRRCLLCPEKCIGRSVPYDAALAKKYLEMAL